MAIRVVNGNTFTENDWPLVDEAGCTWITVPGTNVKIQVQSGQPCWILGAWEADWNAYVEELEDPTTACWTRDNSVLGGYGQNNGSNHLGGTAVDSDWERHPMGPHAPDDPRAGFSVEQVNTIREMIAFYTLGGVQMVWWANDWDSPHDSMHSQMGYNTYNNPLTQQFINQFIRPDGFSTFRRGGVLPPPDPISNQVDVLVRATGISVLRAQQIMPTMLQGLELSQCNTPLRIAMALAQWGHESGSFVYTEEIQSGDETLDRWKYKGRTWIQITWSTNYAGFSQWCYSRGLVPTPTYFVDNPKELADLKWAGIGPAWYWTVARPQINSLCDAGDLVAVTQAINGGQNGAPDRKTRYDKALALGDQLLVLTQSGEDDDMIPPDEWNNLYHALMDDVTSYSPLRHLGEGNIGPLYHLLRNIDGSVHIEVVKTLANLKHPPTIALLQEVAGADPVQYPDRQDDAKLAQAILADVFPQVQDTVVQEGPAQDAPVVVQPMRAVLPAPVQQIVDSVAPQTNGQIIGELYDVLDKLRMADALPIESRAPLAALISVLQTKNGTNLS